MSETKVTDRQIEDVDPSFEVYNSGGQTIANTTFIKVEFNTETTDTGGDFDSTTGYDFTVPTGKAGWYIFTTQLRVQPIADGSFVLLNLYKDGASLKRMGADIVGSTSSNVRVNGSAIVKLAAGDVITIYIFHNSGGNEDIIGGADESWFSGAYLGS